MVAKLFTRAAARLSEMELFLRLIVVLVIIAVLAGWLWSTVPVLRPLPQPTGQYAVGVQTFQFADQKRAETFSDNSSDKRTLMANIFYPVDSSAGLEKYPYLGKKKPHFEKFLADYYHLPLWISKLLLSNTQTHTYINAPLSSKSEKWPIIIFSHGLLGLPSDFDMVFFENLASYGYIVVAVDHPYFNMLTLYPDGKVVSSQKLNEQFLAMRPDQQKEFQNRSIEIYKADIRSVIDHLSLISRDPKSPHDPKSQDSKSIFYKRLDLDRVGVMGHSAGGTVAIELCRADSRCKAAVNLDGWYDQAIGQEPIVQPLLLMFGSKSIEVTEPTAEYLKRKELTREKYYEREEAIEAHKKALCSSPNCAMIIIPGAKHGDFGDPLELTWRHRLCGASQTYKIIAEINRHVTAFFEKYLASSKHV